MRVTVIADNHASLNELTTQHGLSFWIEHAGEALIFDTGSDSSWLGNAERLGIDLFAAKLLFLSHGHWDHGGGIEALVERGWQGTIVCHPQAWRKKRAVAEGIPERDVGLPWRHEDLEARGVRFELVEGAREVFPGIWSTGPIAGDHPAPVTPQLQGLDAGRWAADDFRDEHSLAIKTPRGLVVVTGCCHRGVLNTLETARSVTGEQEVYALVGGLHQKDEPRERCHALARAIRAAGVTKVWANHCTGLHPFAQMREILGDDLVWAEAGLTIEI